MFKKKERFSDIGTIKKDTNDIVTEALEKQSQWRTDRKGTEKLIPAKKGTHVRARADNRQPRLSSPEGPGGWRAYWFPILCTIIIVLLILWAILPLRGCTRISPVPEPTTNTVVVNEKVQPSFDLVRIENGGKIVVAGRYLPGKNVSIMMNKEIVATVAADKNGEFVYAPAKKFDAGDYVIRLVAVDSNDVTDALVFVYMAPDGAENSMSLLMTAEGSQLLQSPKLADGDLVVTKIDYLANGRIVAQGTAIPRLRVSMSLDGTDLGFARVSDHKNFGLGADVGALKPGQEYKLDIRLHDSMGNTAATVTHKFVMPEMTGADDTFYTVRRDDCLWFISRNFLGTGTLFTIIAEKNHIANPDLIYPKQKLQIPVKAK